MLSWLSKKMPSLVMSKATGEGCYSPLFAGLHVWASTLTNLVKMYATKLGVDKATRIERL